MNRTFLLNLDLNDAEDPSIVADDILDDLIGAGYSVVSVKPWSTHNAGADLGQGSVNTTPLGSFNAPGSTPGIGTLGFPPVEE